MVKFLIQRPIAVTVVFVAFVVMSLVGSGLIPVSLMPPIDIPEIIVKIDAPEKSSREVETQYMNRIRRELLQVSHLEDVESYSANGQGYIRLLFEYGSNINYAFIEVNEKVDALMHGMPRDFNRPRVIRTSASDLPVFYLNVALKNPNENNHFMELSEFCEQVIKKRVEQMPEVAMADISGTEFPEIVLKVDMERLQSLGVSQETFGRVLEENNYSVGNIKVRSGLYEYNVRYSSSQLINRADIEELSVMAGQRFFKLKELAQVIIRPQQGKGQFWANDKRAVVMAVIKKSNARMADLKEKTTELMELLKKDYPRMEFTIERNQTELLDYSIGNLRTGLVFGATLAFLIMFLFMKDLKSPVLIGISVPLSLVISLLFFFLIDLSINIISLSGLILGVGMMIDNSIIVIDNISQYRDKGLSVFQSCIKGTNEVIRPLISSVLTTCAVFVPLVFIKGVAGSLFYDQAMAVSIGLGVSLLVSFTFIPVYFKLFYGSGREKTRTSKNIFDKLHFYDHIEDSYASGFNWLFKNRKLFLTGILLLLVAGGGAIYEIRKEKFPAFNENEAIIQIDWNRNVQVNENRRRILQFLKENEQRISEASCMIGNQDFVLDRTNKQGTAEAQLYIKTVGTQQLDTVIDLFYRYYQQNYPEAIVDFSPPETLFQKMFRDKRDDLEIRLKSEKGMQPEPEEVNQIKSEVEKLVAYKLQSKLRLQDFYEIVPDYQRMQLYGVNVDHLIAVLQRAFSRLKIFTLKQGQNQVPVFLAEEERPLHQIIASLKVRSDENADVPVSALVDLKRTKDYHQFTGDRSGTYVPMSYAVNQKEADEIENAYRQVLAGFPGIKMDVTGSLVENRELFTQLLIIMLVSLLLLYFILAAQFESLTQPLIIFTEIPIDIAGAVLLLWVTGNSLNLMALIGIIVMAGIIINDSILKIDTINRLVRSGYPVMEAIHTGGKRRLKPIIMTSATTILAMVPFLFGDDLGSRLQQPLALCIIGGMTIGTLVSLYFIPLSYYYLIGAAKK
jgi:multidrug efflux pump subunit AcrB